MNIKEMEKEFVQRGLLLKSLEMIIRKRNQTITELREIVRELEAASVPSS